MSRNLVNVHTIENASRSAADVRAEVHAYIDEGKAVICPCCDQYAMMNTRKITPTMARQLVQLAQAGTPLDAKDLQRGNDGRERMYSLLRFWGLVTKLEASTWEITKEGIEFVLGNTKAAKFAFVYNNALVALDNAEFVTIQECFGSEFDLEEVFSTEEKVKEARL